VLGAWQDLILFSLFYLLLFISLFLPFEGKKDEYIFAFQYLRLPGASQRSKRLLPTKDQGRPFPPFFSEQHFSPFLYPSIEIKQHQGKETRLLLTTSLSNHSSDHQTVVKLSPLSRSIPCKIP
jgi:hypothetical protein